jgi:hypothetical protein
VTKTYIICRKLVPTSLLEHEIIFHIAGIPEPGVWLIVVNIFILAYNV